MWKLINISPDDKHLIGRRVTLRHSSGYETEKIISMEREWFVSRQHKDKLPVVHSYDRNWLIYEEDVLAIEELKSIYSEEDTYNLDIKNICDKINEIIKAVNALKQKEVGNGQ